MVQKPDKRARARLFRDRLTQALAASPLNQSSLARATGVDRSTLSQILSDDGARMPGGQLVAECAAALHVSADWLLGLSDFPEQATTLLASALTMTAASRALIDDQVLGWHQEAAGYKIRHVPAGLPDMLKTPDVLHWEYEPSIGRTIDQALDASHERMELMRAGGSDYEIAMPLTELTTFARAEGYYAGLAPDIRRHQITHLRDLTETLYPKLRLHLFDPRKLYSAPLSVYGPLLTAIYIGHSYLVFRDTDRVQAITWHFDQLVREAAISSRAVTTHLTTLFDEVR